MSTDLPELIRNITPRNEKGDVWILAKRLRDKHSQKDNENGIDTDAENNEHLANLGTFFSLHCILKLHWHIFRNVYDYILRLNFKYDIL